MAFTSSGSFVSVNSKIAATTLGIVPSSPATAGSLAVLLIATDNLTANTASNDVLGVTDSVNNRWFKVGEFSDGSAAAAGATISMFYCRPSTSILTTSSITASFNASITAKAASGWVFTQTVVNPYTLSTAVTQSQGTSPGAVSLSNLTGGTGNYLFFRGIAVEDTTTNLLTVTTAFTQSSANGTSGGGGATNMQVRGEFKIATTASLLSNPTISAATSNASFYAAFFEAGRTQIILLD